MTEQGERLLVQFMRAYIQYIYIYIYIRQNDWSTLSAYSLHNNAYYIQ